MASGFENKGACVVGSNPQELRAICFNGDA